MKKITITAVVLLLISIATVRNPANADMILPKSKVQTVNVDGRYSIELPTYLTPGYDLNYEASLQYQNIYKEVYIIIIDESKQDFIDVFREIDEYDTTKTPLENYVNAQMQSIRDNMATVTSESKIRLAHTGCGEAKIYDVAGTQDGIDDPMGFTVGFYEGKLNLYMIMTWTFEKTKSVYQADMDAMLVSFTELSGAIDNSPYHIQNERCSIEFPRYFTQDTTYDENTVASFSSYDDELYLSVNEYLKSLWSEGYKTWPDRKTKTFLDYFTIDQRNFMFKNSPKDTHSTETLAGKSNGSEWRTVSFTEPASDEYVEWYREFRIVEGKDHFFMIELNCPVSNHESNRIKMNTIFESFKVL